MNVQPINAADRRVAERRSALDAYLCLVDLGGNRSAMLLDVSEIGIGVQAVEGPPQGFSTPFRFQLPETAVLVEGEGEIAWADRAGRMGIRFTKIAPELKPELRQWVSSEANPLFADQPVTESMADLDARDRVAQLEARIIVSGWAQIQALNFLVDQIAAMTQAGGVAIAVEDGGGIVCKASSGIAPEVGVRVDPRSGLSWECVRTGEVVTCLDTETDPRVDRIVCRQLNLRSAMLVPVKKDGRVAGLVEVFSSQPHAFSNQTVILLRRVAEAVASLDETAPDLGEDSVLQMPSLEPPVPMAATPVMERAPAPGIAEVEKKGPALTPVPVSVPAPVLVKPAPQHAPAASAPVVVKPIEPPPVPAPPVPVVVRPIEPPQPVAPKPVAVASVPAAVTSTPSVMAPPPAPRPAAAVPAPPVVQKIVTPPVPPPPPVTVKPVAKPATAEGFVAPEKPVVVPPPVVTKGVEPPVVKPAAERFEFAPTLLPPKEAPAVVIAPKPVERVASVEKPPAAPPSPPAPPRVVTSAHTPAKTFGGPASTATRMAPAVEAPKPPAPPKREQKRAEPPVVEVPELSYMLETAGTPDRRRMYIGVAAAAMITLSAIGGWYLARAKPAPKSTPVTQTANPQPATTPLPVALPVAPAAATNAPADAVSSSKPAASTTAQTQPAKTAPTPAQPTATTTANQSAPSPPITAATFIAPSEPAPAAPPVSLAPPNTAGMATILAGPVVTPRLSRAAVSQGVTGGKQLQRVQPIYPTTARTMRLSGLVTLQIHINRNGTVGEVKVVSGHPLLNAAAVDAVRRWKYEPFMLNGQSIENDINVQVRFDLPR